jgi:hypothetical protein
MAHSEHFLEPIQLLLLEAAFRQQNQASHSLTIVQSPRAKALIEVKLKTLADMMDLMKKPRCHLLMRLAWLLVGQGYDICKKPALLLSD